MMLFKRSNSLPNLFYSPLKELEHRKLLYSNVTPELDFLRSKVTWVLLVQMHVCFCEVLWHLRLLIVGLVWHRVFVAVPVEFNSINALMMSAQSHGKASSVIEFTFSFCHVVVTCSLRSYKQTTSRRDVEWSVHRLMLMCYLSRFVSLRPCSNLCHFCMSAS